MKTVSNEYIRLGDGEDSKVYRVQLDANDAVICIHMVKLFSAKRFGVTDDIQNQVCKALRERQAWQARVKAYQTYSYEIESVEDYYQVDIYAENRSPLGTRPEKYISFKDARYAKEALERLAFDSVAMRDNKSLLRHTIREIAQI